MWKRFRNFRLRTLLVFVAIVCVGLTVYQRVRHYQLLAHEHHYSALKAGYKAMQLQGSSFNRSAMEAAYPHWEQSVRRSLLADYYIQVSQKPWIILLPAADFASLPVLPEDDADLPSWWQHHLATHVKHNGLDCNWGSYSDRATSERNVALLNVRPSSFNRFLALTNPELFTKAPEMLPED